MNQSHRRAMLAVALMACVALCAVGGTAIAAPRERTLRLEPIKATVTEDEANGMRVVFVGGTRETTLILPFGADPSGMISYRVIGIASGREWEAANRDPRSFAADTRRGLAAGEKLEQRHVALEFRRPGSSLAEKLPAGRYRIVVTYDEGKTFRPENRTSRVLRSEPVEVVVTAR